MQQVALDGSAACESLYLTQARLPRQLMETLSCKGFASYTRNLWTALHATCSSWVNGELTTGA